jgi:hypothetical protein
MDAEQSINGWRIRNGLINCGAMERDRTASLLVEEQNFIGCQPRFIPHMGDHQSQQTVLIDRGAKRTKEGVLHSVVEERTWLVENQHVTRNRLNPRKHHPLSFTAAQGAGVSASRKHIRKSQRFDGVLNRVSAEGATKARRIFEAGDVVPDTQFVEHNALLGNNRNIGVGWRKLNGSILWLADSQSKVTKGRFPHAAWSHERNDFASG